MKKLIITTLAVITISLSSCLKDKPNVDFSHIGYFVELVGSGLSNFSSDAITAPDDTISIAFQANVDGDYAPSTDTKVTVGVDNTLITKYEATNSAVAYLPLPAGSYVISNPSITIKGGTRLGTFNLTIYKNQLDPTLSYMLPVAITSSNQPISGNLGVHYYHFIGNDFAGTYHQIFHRWNADDSTSVALNGASFTGTVTLLPVSPTEFTAKSGYAGSLVSYDVTFTKNSDGTYSNFAVKLLPSDIGVLTANGLTQIQAPKFVVAPVAGTHYTKAQAQALFWFQWIAMSSADRYLTDQYYK